MKRVGHVAVIVLAVLSLWLTYATAQTSPTPPAATSPAPTMPELIPTAPPSAPALPTVEEVAKKLGFNEGEIEQIKDGQIINTDLKEGSDKELAGVVAGFFNKPVKDVVVASMLGKMLENDRNIQAFHAWSPDDSADEAFAEFVGMTQTEIAEARIFANASPGSKLNLSTADIALFQGVFPSPTAENVPLRAMLKARYEAYQQGGLQAITPYARGAKKTSSPAEELTQAIKESIPAESLQDYFKSLLRYPATPLPDVSHRFYWFKREVDGRPTFILADRASRRTETATVLSEVQYYVGHSYNSSFITSGCLAVEGGTLAFCINRTFTDQVDGWGSGLKRNLGRAQMFFEVQAGFSRMREQFQK
jgi:hypothetical protein